MNSNIAMSGVPIQFDAPQPGAKLNRLAQILQLQNAMQQQEDAQQTRAQQEAFLSGLQPPTSSNQMMNTLYQGVKARAVPIQDYIKAMQPKELPFNKVDPKDYTPESISAFSAAGGDYTKLVPARKRDFVNGTAVDPYATAPGTVIPKQLDPTDARKDLLVPDATGKLVPNSQLVGVKKDIAKSGASNTNISVNTEKSLLNEVAGGLGKGLTTAKDNAQGAAVTIATVGRLMDALDSGAMAGPGTSFKQFGLQLGTALGVAGKDGQEKLLNTRQVIQSLAQLEIDGAQQLKGQGQITDTERQLIKRAASGDVDGMTGGELRLLGNLLERSARAKIQGYNTQVDPLTKNPNAAPLAPFLKVPEPAARTPAAGAPSAVRRYNPATGKIE